MRFRDFFNLLEAEADQAAYSRPYLQNFNAAQIPNYKYAQSDLGTKFMGGKGMMFCGLCNSEVLPKEVRNNDQHLYNTGLWYECNCGDCKFWGNSVRKPEELRSYLAGKNNNASIGFCYDTYCGYCNGHHTIVNIKDDMIWNNMVVGLHACRKCGKNNHLLVHAKQGRPSDMIRTYEKLMPNVERGGKLFQLRRKLTGLDYRVGH